MIKFLNRVLMEAEAGQGGAPTGGATAAAPAAPQAASAPLPAATPATATPAAPAAPATPAEGAQAEPLIGGSEAPLSFEKTGNVSLDVALEFVGKHGFGLDHPAMVQAGEGNFDLLRATFAQLGAKAPPGWEQMVAIGEAAFKEYAAQHQASVEAEGAIHNQIAESMGVDVGDMVAWANANADQAEKDMFNKVMDMGGMAAQAMIHFMCSQYVAANGQKEQGKSAVVPTAAAQPSGGNQAPITRAQLAEEGRKLYQQYGDNYLNTREYSALLRRVR